jgi:hypothetical protein
MNNRRASKLFACGLEGNTLLESSKKFAASKKEESQK